MYTQGRPTSSTYDMQLATVQDCVCAQLEICSYRPPNLRVCNIPPLFTFSLLSFYMITPQPALGHGYLALFDTVFNEHNGV